MPNIYKLAKSPQVSNLVEVIIPNTPFFIEEYWEWSDIDLNTYNPIVFKLYQNQNGVKNFKSDLFILNGALCILSPKASNALDIVLSNTGQYIDIVTPSKRKIYKGFYPNKNVFDDSIINLNKSVWTQEENGKLIQKLVLNSNYPKNESLFVLKDEPMAVYVTDKFKDLVESNNLVGFDFSKRIEISD